MGTFVSVNQVVVGFRPVGEEQIPRAVPHAHREGDSPVGERSPRSGVVLVRLRNEVEQRDSHGVKLDGNPGERIRANEGVARIRKGHAKRFQLVQQVGFALFQSAATGEGVNQVIHTRERKTERAESARK